MDVLRALTGGGERAPEAGQRGQAVASLSTAPNLRAACVWLAVLLVLCLAAFRSELVHLRFALRDVNAAHALAAPLVILMLVLLRREALARQWGGGSGWGVALLVAAIGVLVVSSWPFNYGYPRRAAIVPALAGVILAVGGWRALRLCLPILLVVLLAIPVGTRYYAFLIIKPETYTLDAVQATLDLMPGVLVDLEGPDLYYFGRNGAGTIALGEHFRGAALLLAYLTIGVFVAFARLRPWWQLVVLGAAAPIIALFCNYARLVIWGLLTICGNAHPLSAMPRLVSSAVTLLIAYGLFVLLSWVVSKIIIEVEPATASGLSPADK